MPSWYWSSTVRVIAPTLRRLCGDLPPTIRRHPPVICGRFGPTEVRSANSALYRVPEERPDSGHGCSLAVRHGIKYGSTLQSAAQRQPSSFEPAHSDTSAARHIATTTADNAADNGLPAVPLDYDENVHGVPARGGGRPRRCATRSSRPGRPRALLLRRSDPDGCQLQAHASSGVHRRRTGRQPGCAPRHQPR